MWGFLRWKRHYAEFPTAPRPCCEILKHSEPVMGFAVIGTACDSAANPMTVNISLYISRPQKSQPIKNLLNMKIPLQKTPHRESK